MLAILGREAGPITHLDSLSSSIPNRALASSEKRLFGVWTAREGLDEYDERLLVLKFFGSLEASAEVGLRKSFDSVLSSNATVGRVA